MRSPENKAKANRFYTALTAVSDWKRYSSESRRTFDARIDHEKRIQQQREFVVEGWCYPCRMNVSFEVNYDYAYIVAGVLTPNWREQLRCPHCGLNSRMRASIELFEQLVSPRADAKLLLAEQSTPLYPWFARKYQQVVGFEFLGHDLPYGTKNADGVRNETLTALTFPDESFDHVLVFDVLEHVPDYKQALREVARVLRAHGSAVLSVPFRTDSAANTVRARYAANGSIEHLLPPEYHGDPLSTKGCLAYYHFGWELLDDIKTSGFSNPTVYHYWSEEKGYLGSNQLLVTASKN